MRQQDPLPVRLRRAIGFRQPPVSRLRRKPAGAQQTFNRYQGNATVVSVSVKLHAECYLLLPAFESAILIL